MQPDQPQYLHHGAIFVIHSFLHYWIGDYLFSTHDGLNVRLIIIGEEVSLQLIFELVNILQWRIKYGFSSFH